MFYFDGIIVVEGKGDASYLSSFINSEYVITNGYEISKDLIDYLTHISGRKIVLLVDPDEAGRNIEKKLIEKIPNCDSRCANIRKCNKHGKHGIAECEKEEILSLLKDVLTEKNEKKETFSRKDFIATELYNNKEKREYVSNKLHIYATNSKILFKRLNYNSYTKEDIIKLWK